jgi:hypothetical protein
MRYGLGLFLLAWLAGWSAFEWLILRGMVWAFEGGWQSPAARALTHPMGWLVGGFLVVWSIGWTIGGLVAVGQLARLIAGVDRISISPDGWSVRRGVGPLGVTRHFPLSEVRDVYVQRPAGPLILETKRGDRTLTSFGSIVEWRAMADRFGNPHAIDELPPGWSARQAAGGVIIGRSSLDSPGCLGIVAIVAAMSFAYALLFRSELASWGIALALSIAVLMAALFLWGLFSRREWVVRRGEVRMVVRWLAWRREKVFDPESLQLTLRSDSDGDEWVTLAGTVRGRRTTLFNSMNDARTALRLARAVENASGWRIPVPHGLAREARGRV